MIRNLVEYFTSSVPRTPCPYDPEVGQGVLGTVDSSTGKVIQCAGFADADGDGIQIPTIAIISRVQETMALLWTLICTYYSG